VLYCVAMLHMTIFLTYYPIFTPGKAVSKFCARHLHKQVLINDANSSGDLPTSLHKAFLR
jgi:hypothetical protein